MSLCYTSWRNSYLLCYCISNASGTSERVLTKRAMSAVNVADFDFGNTFVCSILLKVS